MQHQQISVLARHVRHFSAGWKQRRDLDIYANRAIKAGLRSRAAYKLEELNRKFGNFLRQGAYVVDLGASPGGFSKIASEKIHLDTAVVRWNDLKHVNPHHIPEPTSRTMGGMQRTRRFGKLICVDTKDMEEIDGAMFVQGDITNAETHRKILNGLNGREADVVLSDMSPSTTGEKERDHLLIMELADEAFNIAKQLLRNGGIFCCKVFAGAEETEFRNQLEDCFVKVKKFKPAASKQFSKEVYYVGKGYVPQHFATRGVSQAADLLDLAQSQRPKKAQA